MTVDNRVIQELLLKECEERRAKLGNVILSLRSLLPENSSQDMPKLVEMYAQESEKLKAIRSKLGFVDDETLRRRMSNTSNDVRVTAELVRDMNEADRGERQKRRNVHMSEAKFNYCLEAYDLVSAEKPNYRSATKELFKKHRLEKQGYNFDSFVEALRRFCKDPPVHGLKPKVKPGKYRANSSVVYDAPSKHDYQDPASA